MLTASTPALELAEAYVASDPRGRVFPAFPIHRFAGAEHTAVVYFEVQPGDYLPTHTDSAEEILYIVAGEGEARVGDERARVQAGDLAVIPAMVPTASPTPATRPCGSSASSARARSSRRSRSRCTRWG
jgi:quercetin dioxygenase-like cupin family protein